MISRRNIRVKVMQAIYSMEALFETGVTTQQEKDDLKYKALKRLDEDIKSASDLFSTALLYVAKVAQYAETDARLRASKYLPTQEDLHVNTRIAGNIFLWEILDNATFKEKIKSDKLEESVSGEWVKKLYQNLSKSEAYKNYIEADNRKRNGERDMIQHIWVTEMLANEDFMEHFAEENSGWDDDGGMVQMLMGNYFRNNKDVNFLKFISTEKREYATQLLSTVIDKQDYCMELIKPKLKNWDAERVAAIDIILLRMGLCEFLYFPTIPTKVTINEYIEIAKNYSTPQSGQFVNGVLDNLLKDLVQQNKVRKIDRKQA